MPAARPALRPKIWYVPLPFGRSCHCWFAPPFPAHCSSCVPVVVDPPGTSSTCPELTFVNVSQPLVLPVSSHCWAVLDAYVDCVIRPPVPTVIALPLPELTISNAL